MPEKYLKRAKGFFPEIDANNCQRIYEAIVRAQQDKRRRRSYA